MNKSLETCSHKTCLQIRLFVVFALHVQLFLVFAFLVYHQEILDHRSNMIQTYILLMVYQVNQVVGIYLLTQ